MDKINEFGDKIKSIDVKKVVKTLVVLFGIILIVVLSFFEVMFDFGNMEWDKWGAKTTVLTGIMIFGVLMGVSTGSDIQKDKAVYDDKGKLVGGLYQLKCVEYNEIRLAIKPIEDMFSSWWLYFKEKKLIEKKQDYLIENQVDMRVAKLMVKHLTKDDFVIGKMISDPNKPYDKIYVKELENGEEIKFKKIKQEESAEYIKIFNFKLETYDSSYYMSLYDNGKIRANDAEIARTLETKIKKDIGTAIVMRIISSIVISIVWSAITVSDFTNGDPMATKRAWINLLTRFTSLVTSYISGFSLSVVHVRDQARVIENKAQILSNFKKDIDNKSFVPETYEESIEREHKEQLEHEPKEVEVEIVDDSNKKDEISIEKTNLLEHNIYNNKS